eukprot:jgi/Mesen1/2667/ME000167S01817
MALSTPASSEPVGQTNAARSPASASELDVESGTSSSNGPPTLVLPFHSSPKYTSAPSSSSVPQGKAHDHGYHPPSPPTFGLSSPSRAAAPVPPPARAQQASRSSQQSTSSESVVISPVLALDAYSVPSLSLPSPVPRGPPSFFEGDDGAAGPGVYGTDLSEDNLNGAETSEPFVQFTASLVHNERRVTNTASLGVFGALLSPVCERAAPRPPAIRRRPLQCEACGAYSNLYCALVPHTGEWRCVFCGRGNFSQGEYMVARGEGFGQWAELGCRVVEYTDASARRLSTASEAAAMGAPTVLVVDESLDAQPMRQLQASLLDLLGSLPPSLRIGIVTYGASVAVYDVALPGVASADVLPGGAPLGPASLKALLYGTGTHVAPLHACLPVVQGIVASLRPYRGGLPVDERARAMGVAIQVALALVRGPASELPRSPMKRSGGISRVIACAGGPPTHGPGGVSLAATGAAPATTEEQVYEHRSAVKFMEGLGREARRLETAVDVLMCCGAAAAAGGGAGSGGESQEQVRDPATEQPFPEDRSSVLEMLGVEDGLGLALSFELLQDVPHPFLHFQFATSYTNLQQLGVVRVVTVRVPTTGSVTAYLQAVDQEAAAVHIAKRTLLLAESAAGAREQRRVVDDRVKDLAKRFGAPALPGTRLLRFPKELPRLAEALYHLRRGPLLGGEAGGGSAHEEDERAMLRSLFLRATCEQALPILVPRVFLLAPPPPPGEGGAARFAEVPPYDLAQQPRAALVLDHGTDIFTWLGAELARDGAARETAEQACAGLAAELSAARFPAPRQLVAREGTSAANHIAARLVPAHKDAPSDQEAWFPQLAQLSPEERSNLRAKFVPTDDLSFLEWMRGLRLAPY